MKKGLLVGLMMVAMFLFIPLAVNASPYLGTGYMEHSYSGPSGNYYWDYDGKVTSSNFGYSPLNTWFEMFCVSNENGGDTTYAFYAIRPDMPVGNFANLSMAAWVADNWTSFFGVTPSTQDDFKGEAQKAVWALVGVTADGIGTSGDDFAIYTAALSHQGYLSNTQILAYSPSGVGQCEVDYQDFIVPGNVSVPEPATLMLLGLGLVGIAGIRRKLKK